jgi:hypothetical protein
MDDRYETPFRLTGVGIVCVIATVAGHVLALIVGGSVLACNADPDCVPPPPPFMTWIALGGLVLAVASWIFWGGRAVRKRSRTRQGIEAHHQMRAAYKARDDARWYGLPWPVEDGLPTMRIQRSRTDD